MSKVTGFHRFSTCWGDPDVVIGATASVLVALSAMSETFMKPGVPETVFVPEENLHVHHRLRKITDLFSP